MSSCVYSLFLQSDGTVKSCGSNSQGQCGTGDIISPKLDVTLIPGLTDVAQVAAGDTYSLFLLKDGTVKSCGSNSYGQCGTGNTASPKLSVTAVSGLSCSDLQNSAFTITLPTPEEMALIKLNTGIVTTDKIATAMTLFNTPKPKNYANRTQKAIAQHMPKKDDPDFTNYTPENFQARLDAATIKAEKKHSEAKRLYAFMSKLPSLKI